MWQQTRGILPTSAEQTYDGLEWLGQGVKLVDKQSDSTMQILAFEGKYDEKVVGVYITQHGREVRFYMDQVTWDKLKQTLVRTRDQWETLSPTEFNETGEVRGYRVANRRRCQGKIGKQHRVVKADTQEWFKRKYDGIILAKKID